MQFAPVTITVNAVVTRIDGTKDYLGTVNHVITENMDEHSTNVNSEGSTDLGSTR
jgi:hypothetical protein